MISEEGGGGEGGWKEGRKEVSDGLEREEGRKRRRVRAMRVEAVRRRRREDRRLDGAGSMVGERASMGAEHQWSCVEMKRCLMDDS